MIIGSIILAGGRSRRMGQPKESLPFRGSTLLGQAVETLLGCTHPVVVMARDEDQELPPLPIEADVGYDPQPGGGPLVALAGGLAAIGSESDAVFVTACDTPFLDARVVEWLANQLGDHSLVIPRAEGVLQPLAALYRTGVAPEVDALIATGERSLQALVDRVHARILEDEAIAAFDPDRRFLRGINTPEDYRAAVHEAERG